MTGSGAGAGSVLNALKTYIPTLGKDVLIVIGLLIAMGFGIALFRKGVQWFRGLVK